MADNYLEKRMDDLRKGRLAIKHGIPGIRPRARRVAIVGRCNDVVLSKIKEFRREGCRVALLDDDAKSGKSLAYHHGIRFHRVDPEDEPAITSEIEALLATWRGLDVIVGAPHVCRRLEIIIRNWKESLPAPDKSGLEIVII